MNDAGIELGFEVECRTQFGVDFEVLESQFWAAVERLAGDPGTIKREILDMARRLPSNKAVIH